MSVALETSSRKDKPTTSGRRPLLRALPTIDNRISRLPFIFFLGAVLALGMAGVLILNVTIQEQASELRRLQIESRDLGYQKESLRVQVEELRSPTNLQSKAQELGMRPNPYPVFIQLPDGIIIGEPQPVTGEELPDISYAPVQEQSDKIDRSRFQARAPKPEVEGEE